MLVKPTVALVGINISLIFLGVIGSECAQAESSPIVLLILLTLTVAATIGVLMNVTYGFTYANLAAFYVAPVRAEKKETDLPSTQFLLFACSQMIGVVIGEIAGHFVNGYIQRVYMKRNAGAWTPEARLWVNYVACPFLIAGLLIFGFGLERHWNYMWVAFGWVSHACFQTIDISPR